MPGETDEQASVQKLHISEATEQPTPSQDAGLVERVAKAICIADGECDNCGRVCSKTMLAYGAAAVAALETELASVREALEPFVRCCETFTADDFPLHIGNDISASAYDLTLDEVERARAAIRTASPEKP